MLCYAMLCYATLCQAALEVYDPWCAQDGEVLYTAVVQLGDGASGLEVVGIA